MAEAGDSDGELIADHLVRGDGTRSLADRLG